MDRESIKKKIAVNGHTPEELEIFLESESKSISTRTESMLIKWSMCPMFMRSRSCKITPWDHAHVTKLICMLITSRVEKKEKRISECTISWWYIHLPLWVSWLSLFKPLGAFGLLFEVVGPPNSIVHWTDKAQLAAPFVSTFWIYMYASLYY